MDRRPGSAVPRRSAWILAPLLSIAVGCGSRDTTMSIPVPGLAPPTVPPSSAASVSARDADLDPSSTPTSLPTDDSPSPDSPTPTVAATTTATTVVPIVTIPPPPPPEREIADPFFGATNAAFDRLAAANPGASLSVARGGQIVLSRAAGATVDGQPANGDSPMVVASVSKMIVAIGIARLAALGTVDIAAPFPWADVGLAPDPGWNDVTVRELLDHRGGLETARYSWFDGAGTCRDHIPSLLTRPPNGDRGRWVYSNGNFCLLGLLVEQRMDAPLDVALQQLVFDPVGASGIHLTDGGLLPGDVPYSEGVGRLSRLGGAGTLIVSTYDIALAVSRLTDIDRITLQPPGMFTDQYGFGHTGTVDGAKSCVWVLEGGATVVSATIAGNSVASGGGICDLVVPAVANDLGLGAGPPDRTP